MKQYIRKFAFFILFSLFLTVPAFGASNLIKKINSFDFLVDFSSSMNERYASFTQSKINLAQDVLAQINKKIPTLDYQGGMHTFAPLGNLYDFQAYNRSEYGSTIEEMLNARAAAGNESLGKGLDAFDPAYSDMYRKGAVIAVTDGKYDSSREALNEAKVFYLTQPGLCLHFISFATTQAEQDLIDQMSALDSCSVSVKAEDLLDNEANVEDFVKKVFYSDFGPAKVEGKVIIMTLNFDLDSSALDQEAKTTSDSVVKHMQETNDSVQINGYTCNLGSVAHNQALSKRRANSVRDYMISQGIAASRITTAGHGLNSPRYDNSTEQGRHLNRRVEFVFE